jgi:hypothetical protein
MNDLKKIFEHTERTTGTSSDEVTKTVKFVNMKEDRLID